MTDNQGKWPKRLPPLSEEQKRINDDFVKAWHEELPRRYGLIERFNHEFPVRWSRPGFRSTLEIGAGLGEHLLYEKLSDEQRSRYCALELRQNMAEEIKKRFPDVKAVVGDCQTRLDFEDNEFDRIVAVHVLEHLPDLPACIREMYRLIDKQHGQFLVVIPTEGSPAYSLARKISAERIYKRRYGGDYSWFYKREHINLPHEILEELAPYFSVERRRYFPLPVVPMTFCNLCIGLSLVPKA